MKVKQLFVLLVVVAFLVTIVGCDQTPTPTTSLLPTPTSDVEHLASAPRIRELYVDHDLTVGGTATLAGPLSFSGVNFVVDTTGYIRFDADAASHFKTAGAGIDLTFESEAGSVVVKGDEAVATAITLDANDAVTTGVTIQSGSVSGVAITGGPFDVNVTGAVSIDADVASNFNVAGAGIDLTLESEAGRLILKGDEAAANGVTIDANAAVTTGLDIDVGSVSGMTIDGGLVDVGGGSYDTADGDNDLGVAGDVEIDGELELDGALDADSTANIAGALTLQALFYPSVADETITDGETLTPTVTIYNLNAAGGVTFTLAAAGTEGQLLILCGDSAQDITVADTNIRTNDGNKQVINQYDCITWVYIDSEWLELSESNNS